LATSPTRHRSSPPDLVRAARGRLPDDAGACGGAGTAVFDGVGRYVLDADRPAEVALPTTEGVKVMPGGELAAGRVATFD
jgi:hypothetical protein